MRIIVTLDTSGNFQIQSVIAELPRQSRQHTGAHVMHLLEKCSPVGQLTGGRGAADGVAQQLEANGCIRIDINLASQIGGFHTDALVVLLVELIAIIQPLGLR